MTWHPKNPHNELPGLPPAGERGSRIAAWHAAIKLGDEQLDRGEGIADTPDALNEVTQSAIKAMQSGMPVHPEVLP